MKEMIKFLDIHYKDAIKLVNDFDITKNKKWEVKDYLNELYVQIGHVFNVLYNDEHVNEENRNINNLGDELSDVLLQLISLSTLLNIDMYEIKNIKKYEYHDISALPILLGQLSEAIMETGECRFKKNRTSFYTSYDFVKDRLLKLFMITFQIAKQYKLNMTKEFADMLEDANDFLKRFKEQKKYSIEYIDIYDKDEKLLGYCEKEKAHNLGYWHKVIGCFIYNASSNKVYFQVKNPKHNGINKKEYLEITAGGHLISGETLQNGVREIKEETGLNVCFEDLIFLEKRKCNKKISKDYWIKEFQYFYGLDLREFSLLDFKDFDRKEVVSFIEIDINDTIDLLMKRKNKISANKLQHNDSVKINLTIDDFDPAFIENGLYLTLLLKIENRKSKLYIKKQLLKMYIKTNIEKKKYPENFFFDNGEVTNKKDIFKNFIRFSIMEVNKDRNNNEYVVYVKINYNHKSIPMLLEKNFNSRSGSKNYFDTLCDYIKTTSIYEIIENCDKK